MSNANSALAGIRPYLAWLSNMNMMLSLIGNDHLLGRAHAEIAGLVQELEETALDQETAGELGKIREKLMAEPDDCLLVGEARGLACDLQYAAKRHMQAVMKPITSWANASFADVLGPEWKITLMLLTWQEGGGE